MHNSLGVLWHSKINTKHIFFKIKSFSWISHDNSSKKQKKISFTVTKMLPLEYVYNFKNSLYFSHWTDQSTCEIIQASRCKIICNFSTKQYLWVCVITTAHERLLETDDVDIWVFQCQPTWNTTRALSLTVIRDIEIPFKHVVGHGYNGVGWRCWR